MHLCIHIILNSKICCTIYEYCDKDSIHVSLQQELSSHMTIIDLFMHLPRLCMHWQEHNYWSFPMQFKMIEIRILNSSYYI